MKNKEIPVLMYHKFGKTKIDDSYTTVKEFKTHLRILKFLGYETITFSDLKKIKLENRFKKKYIILTCDDGYKNNYEIIFPILKEFNTKVVIYLVSNINYNKWDIDLYGSKKLELMNEKEIKEMIKSGLVEFGGHTLNHIDFHKVDIETARKEIFENKIDLEKKYNISLVSFAYPWGHLTKEVKEIVIEAGYDFAVSTDTGTGKITDDLYDIRRTAIDKTSYLNFLRKISFKYSIYKGKKYKRN